MLFDESEQVGEVPRPNGFFVVQIVQGMDADQFMDEVPGSTVRVRLPSDQRPLGQRGQRAQGRAGHHLGSLSGETTTKGARALKAV